MKKTAIIITFLAVSLFSTAETVVKILPGEKWWGAVTEFGKMMPYDGATTLDVDLWLENYNNQTTPLLVSNQGRYIWCDDVFRLKISGGSIIIDKDAVCVKAGNTLKEAYLGASKDHFPPTGTYPHELFFSQPQFNTWIELRRNQNQSDIMKYVRGILDGGYPRGIIMVDDNWQNRYGNFDFRKDRFPDAKGMMDELHGLGFKVMLWVCPFLTADSEEFKALKDVPGMLVRNREDPTQPAILRWWNGYSALFDMSSPAAVEYLDKQLRGTMEKYGADGFKFDAGDPKYYDESKEIVADGYSYGPRHSELWAKFAAKYEFNELRACWKMGAQPVVQRLGDKNYSWDAVARLIPTMTAAGLMGHIYTCPDMIGGGMAGDFDRVEREGNFDQALIVRSCAIHALMPMMQFSIAPWRVLSPENNRICAKFARLHESFGPYILAQAAHASKTGEPIVRSLEYSFPGQGFEDCEDMFMLGDEYLVAPVVNQSLSREVRLPQGRWQDETGRIYKGGRSYTIDVPLDRLPYFKKIK